MRITKYLTALLFITLLFSSCGGGSSSSSGDNSNNSSSEGDGDDTEVTLTDINAEAAAEGNFPSDSTVIDTSMNMEGEDVDGTEPVELPSSDDDVVEATVTIPPLLSKRAISKYMDGFDLDDLPDLPDEVPNPSDYVSLSLWLNGEYFSISDVVSIGDDLSFEIDLREGHNYLCFVFKIEDVPYLDDFDPVNFRSPVVKIAAESGDMDFGATQTD